MRIAAEYLLLWFISALSPALQSCRFDAITVKKRTTTTTTATMSMTKTSECEMQENSCKKCSSFSACNRNGSLSMTFCVRRNLHLSFQPALYSYVSRNTLRIVWMLLNTVSANPISTHKDRLQIPRHWISNMHSMYANTSSPICQYAKRKIVLLKIQTNNTSG